MPWCVAPASRLSAQPLRMACAPRATTLAALRAVLTPWEGAWRAGERPREEELQQLCAAWARVELVTGAHATSA
jgi:hypothetical protein